MRSYVTESLVSGEVVTERELVGELRDIAEKANQLDDDNFSLNTITAVKLALGAMNIIDHDATETTQTVDVSYTTDGEPIYGVPDSAGNPWVKEFTASGGLLIVSAQVQLGDSAELFNAYAWVGIRIDGEMVARSGDQEAQSTWDTFYVLGMVPVTAGVRVVELVFGFSLSPVVNTTAGVSPIGAPDMTDHATSVQFEDRSFIVREALR